LALLSCKLEVMRPFSPRSTFLAGHDEHFRRAVATSGEGHHGCKLAKLFGLQGDRLLRHANPISVWTRFAVLPLLALSIWSPVWIGWWSLVPIALSLAALSGKR